jgi:hypothetical protein
MRKLMVVVAAIAAFGVVAAPAGASYLSTKSGPRGRQERAQHGGARPDVQRGLDRLGDEAAGRSSRELARG